MKRFRFGNRGARFWMDPARWPSICRWAREVQLASAIRFRCAGEAFNSRNHTNFQLPNTTLDKANVATITGQPTRRDGCKVGVKFSSEERL